MARTMTVMLLALVMGAGPALAQAAAGGQSSPPAPAASAASPAPVNLNTATIAQLESLPGIGRVTAERIVEYREQHGGFKRVEDLMNVRGIGERSFLNLKPLVTVAEAAPRAQ
jgi:competence protein ComEA